MPTDQELLAHSARPEQGVPAQSYASHVSAVKQGAGDRAADVARFAPRHGPLLQAAAPPAGEFHDLGKLDPKNQAVLRRGKRGARLPINHVDAGVASLLKSVGSAPCHRLLAAALIYSHHCGLPSWGRELAKGQSYFRDCNREPGETRTSDYTDKQLATYLELHGRVFPGPAAEGDPCLGNPSQLLYRIALSCLVDADHSDTAAHYQRAEIGETVPLRPDERLAQLDRYVEDLPAGANPERARLRREIYEQCRRGDAASASLWECDSPVGTGKTTAVMAHLLQAARLKSPNLRRIFVVLPFTNIIDQAVDVYRKSLVLPGENPDSVVAAHHHRAEYENESSRHLAAIWGAPIVVTTAVRFFETLAGASTGRLRNLHQLPGSAIFLDESHASLPAKLWPQAWKWIRSLTSDWGCHFVFGSGSLCRIWRIPEIEKSPPTLPQLVEPRLREEASGVEGRRVQLKTHGAPISLDELRDLIPSIPGPRIVVVNTVQIAAALAKSLGEKHGGESVMHLSTALTPHDRNLALGRIKTRLSYHRDDDWTLVATSCVESGVDLSFRNGLRQRASLTSLLQIAGRVNRHGEYESSSVLDFELIEGGFVNRNPGQDRSAEVLGELWREGKVATGDPRDISSESLRREILLGLKADLNRELHKAETIFDFPEVEKLFRVIEQSTKTAVVSKSLWSRLESGKPVDWREVQKHSVQIYANKLDFLELPPCSTAPDVYHWNLAYDEFLGCMAGELELKNPHGFVY